MKKIKFLLVIIIVVALGLLINFCIPTQANAAEYIDVKCNDTNFYKLLLDVIDQGVLEKDDNTKTIRASEESVEGIDTIIKEFHQLP